MEKDDAVTREEWYSAQKFQADVIKELGSDLKEAKGEIRTIANDVKLILVQTTKTNGSVRDLQKFQKDSEVVIEDYKRNKTRIWTTLIVGSVFIATIATLSNMVIDNKISDGIRTALAQIK